MNSLIPSDNEINTLKKVAEMAIKSKFLPQGISTPEQAIIIALKGKELGIPPMQSFAQIAVIQGKPTISAELMMALVYKNVPTAEVIFTKSDNHGCTLSARRRKEHAFSSFSFNETDAKTAGLLLKDTWKKYPGAMYRARAISIMARALFADAISGCSYTHEEMGASVDSEGSIINVTPQEQGSLTSGLEDKSGSEVIENVSPNKHPVSVTSDPATYVIPFGKDKGMRLIDLPLEARNKKRDFLLNDFTGTLTAEHEEFILLVDMLDTEPNANFPIPNFEDDISR